MRVHPFRLAHIAATVTLFCACGSERETVPSGHEPGTMRERLAHLLADTSSMGQLEVEYDDMHSFHGGETLIVKGDTLKARYLFRGEVSPRQIEPPPVLLTAQQMRRLVQVLLEIEAWEQRVPPREANLDESAASLSIRLGSVESRIWEWYNDLSGNDRIVKVMQLLEEFAGPAPEEPSSGAS